MTTSVVDTTKLTSPLDRPSAGPVGKRHYGTHIFLTVMAIMWLTPLLWTVLTALRPKSSVDKHGYFSLKGTYNFDNFTKAWNQAGLQKYFVNSLIITVPTVILTIFLASMMAFAVSRFTWKFNVTLLVMFTAGNLLPPQVLAAPLFEMFKHTSLPYSVSDSGNLLNTYYSVIIVDTAFQIGFCTFVLSNYMKALPDDLTEAALVDGAGVWRQYISIILPLCRPALAALATLETIFIYNDFFWPLLFIQNGDRLPITTGIKNLQGQFFQDYNLIAAGATITVIPTLVVYVLLQRHFVAGLTLGASKG
ncbi:MAG: multiple sugar transport system permease protein [Pseudonocardiales bacterium]|jgi:multiple sugar transport system permease protein|nr:multiple sugar transport system permease protein [Pseudonocardiales bacterium]